MRAEIMGILNVTPDSFSDGGRFLNPEAAIAEAHRMIAGGADIIDVGGESTRPGAQPVPAEEELSRVLPVIQTLASAGIRISIDTMKPSVAEECLKAGASIVNDVTRLRDPAMAAAAARHNAAVVVMHMRGTPATMREFTHYNDLMRDIKAELAPRIDCARRAGVRHVIVDPGIGFAKTAPQNFEILARLNELEELGCPVLIGPSRKSFLAAIPGLESPDQRLEGTIAAAVAAVLNGASIVRVHDVAPCRKAMEVANAIKGASWTKSS